MLHNITIHIKGQDTPIRIVIGDEYDRFLQAVNCSSEEIFTIRSVRGSTVTLRPSDVAYIVNHNA